MLDIHRKKRFASFPSPSGMSLPNSPWAGIMTSLLNYSCPGEVVSDIPAGDGKLVNLFFYGVGPRKRRSAFLQERKAGSGMN
jgi:hypothetical protein